jgi:N-hydroxyarylamine O-acetyltransferase
MPFNARSYLDRIVYSGSTEPTAENLRAIHRAHMLAVPFENLDIHIGRPIVCDERRFLHKIVSERRGGFCYELNGAFAALLRELGYQVTLLSARVTRADGSESPELDHLTLRVDLPEPRSDTSWLADVGFGDSFIEPLLLLPNIEQRQIGRVYRLIESENRWHMEVMLDGNWKRKYSFALQPRQLSDFSAMCLYHQTSPESYFTRQKICSLATCHGRLTLSDWNLIETHGEQREERELDGEEQFRDALRELFHLNLPS